MPKAAAKPTFQVADANRVLPLVRSIVADIVATVQRFREIEAERRATKTSSPRPADAATATRPEGLKAEGLKAELEDLTARTQAYVRELSDLGAEIKDHEKGLVDFACERGGRTVLLCWQLGEPEVAHWHGTDESWFDRRPLTTLPSNETTRARTESGGTSKRPRDPDVSS